jgi:hypothetical protein
MVLDRNLFKLKNCSIRNRGHVFKTKILKLFFCSGFHTEPLIIDDLKYNMKTMWFLFRTRAAF